MRELKKAIVKELKQCCSDVYFDKAEANKDKYICYNLNVGSHLDGFEVIDLNIDIWVVRGKQMNLDELTGKVKKKLNYFHITDKKYGASFYFDRTVYNSSDDEKMIRNTMYFIVRYREV